MSATAPVQIECSAIGMVNVSQGVMPATLSLGCHPLTYATFYVCHVAQPTLPTKNWHQVVPPALLTPLSPALSLGRHPLVVPPASLLFHSPHHCSTHLAIVPPASPLFHPPHHHSTRLTVVPPTLLLFHLPRHHPTHLAIIPPTSPSSHPPRQHPTHLSIIPHTLPSSHPPCCHPTCLAVVPPALPLSHLVTIRV